MQRFRPRLLSALQSYDRRRFVADLGAGLTVGVVALPLAMAFAIASGVKPEQGLVTAIVAGFLISALGGSSVQIGGPAGAFIVVVYGIVERHGLGGLLAATMGAGALLFLMGWLRLGGLVRFVPVAIIVGFTNGIAVLIALSQLRDLLGLDVQRLPADVFAQLQTLGAQLHTLNPWALAIGLACFAGLFVWPRLFVAGALPALVAEGRSVRALSRVPGPVVALVTSTAAVAVFALPVETIGSRFGGIPQSLPLPALPALSWATAKELLMPAVTLALLGAIESLLCARVADRLADPARTPRHDPDQELMAQGVANLAVPFFGGIPATGTIARTVTNVRAGATSPVAGMVHALALLLIVLVAAPLATHVPLAALAGILLFVAWNMGEWREFARLRRFRLPYRAVLLGTFALTVVFDLTVAVEVGLLLACGFFVLRMGRLFSVQPVEATPLPPGVQAVALYGPLFFGAVDRIEALAADVAPGTRRLVLEMHRMISLDTSGLEALRELHAELARRGVELVLARVNEQPLSLIRRSGFEDELGAGRLVPTLEQALADPPAAGAAAR